MKKLLSVLLACLMLLSTGAALAETVDIGDTLVLYSSMTENDLNNLIDGFNAIYPDCYVEVVNGSGGELTARITAEKDNPQGDVMWGALSNADGHTYDDIFAEYTTEYEADLIDDYKSHNGRYNLDHLSTAVFCVNKELEAELGLDIQSYEDLLDPKLKGLIVLSDPNSSSAAWNNLCNIFAVFGYDSQEAWDYIEALLNNGLVISTSSSVCFKSVDSGEYVVGLTYENIVQMQIEQNGADNITLVYPVEGNTACASGAGMIKDCPHYEAAAAFLDFCSSAEYQQARAVENCARGVNVGISYGNYPADEELGVVTIDWEWLGTQKDALLEKWAEHWAEYAG